MKRTNKPIDLTEKKLLTYFKDEWEDCTGSEINVSRVSACRSLKQNGLCDNERNGKNCTFSHHPSKIYNRASKPSKEYLNNIEFQKWVLKFGDMFSNDEFLMEQRLHILRDPHVRLTVIVQAYKKEREEIEKRKGASQKIESEKKVATFDLPIVSKESSLPDSLEPKHENYQKEVRKEHKVLTEDNLKVLLLDLSENQLLQVKKFLPVESFLQQNRLAFNDLVLEATMNDLKFFDAMDSISVKLRGIIESKPSKRLNKKEKLIPLIEEFFQNFPDPLADFQSALFPTNTQINVRESKEIDLTPAFMKSAAIEEKEMENHSEELVRREVSADVNSFNQMLENPLKLYQHYQEICQMRLLEYNCDEEDLKEICEACNCRDHRFPSFFQCMKCSGEIKFCLDCIQPHKYGDNKVTRKHDYLNLCPICLKYDRIIACVDCPDLDRLKCQSCHANYHDLTATHAFNMRKLPSLAIQQIQSLPSQLAPPLKEEPFELSLMVQGKDNVNRKAWGNEPTAINPTLQEKINNQRVVVLLASVVKPILVVLFQVVWCVNHSFCVGCKRSHSFNDIALEPCISSLLLDTNDEVIEDFSATRNSEDDSGFSNKTGKRTVERPALRTYKKLKSDHLRAFDCYKFDYSAVIEVLYCFCYRRELNVFAYLSKQQKEEILYWRNETFHQETLCSELKEKAFSAQQGLPFICKSICSRMNALLTKTFKVFPDWYIMWQSNFDLERKIRSCSEAYTLLEIQEEFENIWMKDSSEASLRDLRRCLSLSKGSYDFRSKQLASLLIDKNVVKLLILPRFQSNGFDRLKYQFLTYIDWVGIIDLNDPLCWDQQQDHEFQPNQLIYSSAQMRPSLAGGNHKILYCKRLTSDLAVEIHKQLHLNDELHVFIVASGVFSSDKLDTFEGRLEDIKDESELKKWKYEIIPLYENFEDLMKPTNWLGEKLSYEEQRERIQKETCSLYSLNSFILANISRESRFILKGLNNHRFGFQTSVIPNGVDLWVDEGDKMLLEEEVKRRELSSEGNAMAVDHTKEVLRDSLEVFLKGGQAEKYLFARGMVVKRNDLEKLISRVKEKDPQNHTPVTVVHGKGKGGTTIARHALYLLQQEGYVCMEIKSDNIASAEFVQFLNLLADTMGHALIKIVIYFDLNRFSDRPSTLMHEILHGDCNAFTTILETTSTRTFNSDSSSSVMKLTPDLVEDEPEQFSKLLEQCVDRYITIKGHILPLDEFGELETEKILKNADLCEVLKKSTRAELSSAGLSPTDVIELKEALHHDYDDFEDAEYSHYVINHDRHKPSRKEMSSVKRRLHFLSMRAYVPQFRDSVRTNLNTLLAGVTPAAIRLLKLCVFYTLFTHLRVPIKVAEYFYQNQYPFDFYSKSDNFSSILKTDEYLSDLIYVHDEGEGKAKISILNIHFAYCLAECSAVFGDISNKSGGDTANVSFSSSSSSSKMIDSERLQVSIGKIRTYIEEELFESLFGQNMQKLHADQRFFLLREVGPGLLDAFCKFQIWHPGTIPDRRDRKTGLPKPREMRNSFLIEAFRIIAARSHMSNRFPIIRDWFRRIVDAYKEMKKDTSDPEIMEFYLTFTTYACRNIAFEAASTHNEQLIEVGKRLLEPFEKNYQVADALGNLCKHHLLIYKYKYCPRPGSSTNSEGHLKIAGAAEKNDHRNDDDDDDDSLLDEAVPADQSQTLTIKSMKQKLEEILVITNEGFFWFKNAAFFSNFNNSNPMVSAAQIITVCLETVRAIITAIGDAKDLPKQERIKRFIAYLKKPKDVLYFEGFLKELNREAFPDRCSAMLTQAKNSIYAGKRSFYEHYAKIRLTERLIARCNDQLTELTVNPKTFAYMSKSEITFPIIEAKLILGGDLDQVPSSASAWCIVACLKWIAEQHNKLTDTLAEKNVDIATLEVIEKYFIASALLAGFTTAKIPSALTPDEELERYLKAANLSHDTAAKASSFMEAVLEKWKSETTIIHEEKSSILQKRSSTFDDNIVNDRSYYGLKGRVMQIMIYIWKILYGKDKENSGKGKLTEEDGEEGEEEEEAKKMNVAALQESLKEMYAFTVAREDANKPSRFICQNLACSRIMPFNPFLHYFFIEGSSIGEKTLSKVLKENPIAREQEYRKPLYQDIFVTFHGRIIYWKSNSNYYYYYYYYEHHNQQHLRSFEGQVPKDKRFTIKCHELSSSSSSINIGFADRYYKDMGFQENDEVSFVIGLTDRGIRAFGVKKVNGQR